ncbi:MAG: hypothetical protein NWQ21_05220, partial [Desulfobacterales bacterium]|nr:hypothetical protein [Desulfobacterales bacterium]
PLQARQLGAETSRRAHCGRRELAQPNTGEVGTMTAANKIPGVRKTPSERRTVLDELAHLPSQEESVQRDELRKLRKRTPLL